MNILKIKFLLLALCISSFAYAQYDSQNVSLYARWDDTSVPAEPTYGIRYSSVFGYAANGREYGIIGSSSGTYFIDVTDPVHPVQCAFYAGRRDMCIWREYQTYQHYLYAVSDDKLPNSLQIFDLDKLPSGINMKVYDSDSIFARSHTVFVEGDKLYCGSAKTANDQYGIGVYSLANPLRPLKIHTLNDEYPQFRSTVHDMYVRHDTVYASCSYDGLFVFKLRADTTFSMIGSLTTYPEQGYNHSSTLTPNGKYLFFADEVPAGLAVKGVDVSSSGDLRVISTFRSNVGDTPHNLYMASADKLVVASYQDGLQIYDVSDPAKPYRTGYFDTFPDNKDGQYFTPAYKGNWGAYVNLPSGTILASDMQRGLFVLNAKLALGLSDNTKLLDKKNVSIYPNPTIDKLTIKFENAKTTLVTITLNDMMGKMLLKEDKLLVAGTNKITLNLPSNLANGVYNLMLQLPNESLSFKVIK
jgi:choice-of-anchor B domain-containing protein